MTPSGCKQLPPSSSAPTFTRSNNKDDPTSSLTTSSSGNQSPPSSSSSTPPGSHDKHDGSNSSTTSYSINNASSSTDKNTSCINIKIKSRGSGIRSLQAIIDTGNNLPHILLSLQAFTALREAGVTKAELQKTSIQATSADSNEIKVLKIVEGNFTLYIGKKVATNVQKFLVIKTCNMQ